MSAMLLYEDLVALEKLFSKPGVYCRFAYKRTDSSGTDHYCLAGGMMFVSGCTEFNSMMLLEPRVRAMYKALRFKNSNAVMRYNDSLNTTERSVRNRIIRNLKDRRKPKLIKTKGI